MKATFGLQVAATLTNGGRISKTFTVDLAHEACEVVPGSRCNSGCRDDFAEGLDTCVEHDRNELQAIASLALVKDQSWVPPATPPPHEWVKTHKESPDAIQAAHRQIRARDHSLPAEWANRKHQPVSR